MSLRKSLTKPIFKLIRLLARSFGKFRFVEKWVDQNSYAQHYDITEKHIQLDHCNDWNDTLKISILSDFHYGAHNNDAQRFTQIVDFVNEKNPDIILLLGDFINTPHLGQDPIIPSNLVHILSKLKAPLGVWGVLGNHDWKHDGTSIQRQLQDVGIQVLENSSHALKFKNNAFSLIGIADDSTRKTDWNSSLSDVPDTHPKIIMAHDPASFIEMPQTDAIMFSGHTHGGQIRIPKFGALANSSRAPLKWSQGFINQGKKQLYVTRGLGTSILPLRINCPPEICFFTIGKKPTS